MMKKLLALAVLLATGCLAQAADQSYWIGLNQYTLDDDSVYPADGKIVRGFRAHQFHIEDAATQSTDAVRKNEFDTLETTVDGNRVYFVEVSDIDDVDTELGGYAGTDSATTQTLLLAYEDPLFNTLYRWLPTQQTADDPYVLDGSSGSWVAVAGTHIQGETNVEGDILPSDNATYDFGAALKAWEDAYYSGNVAAGSFYYLNLGGTYQAFSRDAGNGDSVSHLTIRPNNDSEDDLGTSDERWATVYSDDIDTSGVTANGQISRTNTAEVDASISVTGQAGEAVELEASGGSDSVFTVDLGAMNDSDDATYLIVARLSIHLELNADTLANIGTQHIYVKYDSDGSGPWVLIGSDYQGSGSNPWSNSINGSTGVLTISTTQSPDTYICSMWPTIYETEE